MKKNKEKIEKEEIIKDIVKDKEDIDIKNMPKKEKIKEKKKESTFYKTLSTFTLILSIAYLTYSLLITDSILTNIMKISDYRLTIGYNNFNYTFSSEKEKNQPKNIWLALICGVFIGFINGFFGGGGGMICVPVLTSILKLPEKVAHATTILIILPMCVTSLIIYFLHSELDLALSWPVLVGFVVGGVIGAIILKKINNEILKLVFDFIILSAGVLSIIKF